MTPIEFILGFLRLFYRHKATGIVEIGNTNITNLIPDLQSSPIKADGGVWILDEWYYFCSLADWKRIFQSVLVGMPPPDKDRFDCEDYALLTCARIIEGYQLNAIGIAMSAYHAFNIFKSEQGLLLLEPQSGEVFAAEETEGKYRVHRVIFF